MTKTLICQIINQQLEKKYATAHNLTQSDRDSVLEKPGRLESGILVQITAEENPLTA